MVKGFYETNIKILRRQIKLLEILARIKSDVGSSILNEDIFQIKLDELEKALNTIKTLKGDK
jgi:hypothetical protein